MRAIQIAQTGGPEVLTLVELPTPEPGPGEVRVQARAIGVGRPDLLVRRGTYKWMPPLPAIPGAELAGVVDACGAGVDPGLRGARVLVSARELTTRAGCYAEAICVPQGVVFVLPETISFVDAISLPNFQLANALYQCHSTGEVQAVLVPGAAGGVATALTQIARHKGAQVFGTASTPEKADYARRNGVQHVVSAEPAQMVREIMEHSAGRGVDLAFDHLGAESLIACLRALAPFGMVVSYNVVNGMPGSDVFQEMRALLGRSPAIRAFSMHSYDRAPAARRALMQTAIDQMAQGAVQAGPAQLMGLADIAQAHALLEARASVGKIVIQP
jgi:NADPH2:quinone reductase